jgi:hypothetical protein
VPSGIVPARFVLQTPQRKHLRGGEIANAMFVVDGQRFVGFARRARRARRDLEQTPPAGRRVVELTGPTRLGGQHPQRVNS